MFLIRQELRSVVGGGEISKNVESCNQNSNVRSKWIRGLLSCVGTFSFLRRFSD